MARRPLAALAAVLVLAAGPASAGNAGAAEQGLPPGPEVEGRLDLFDVGSDEMRSLARLAAQLFLAAGRAPAGEGVRVEPIERFGRDGEGRFGPFVFRGGVEVRPARSGPLSRLGALSALEMTPDGTRLLALGDLGMVVEAGPVHEDGRLVSLSGVEGWQRADENGAPVSGKDESDAEAIAVLPRPDGRSDFVVAVEQGRDLLLYPAETGGLSGPARPLPTPPNFTRLVRRGGLEALAVAPRASPAAGSLFVFLEKVLKGERRLRGWRGRPVEGADGRAFAFEPIAVETDDDWSVTGASFLPGGDLLLLERRYRGGLDLAMRIRRIGRDAVTGPVLDGPVVMEADLADGIDNMEGIATHVSEDGEIRVTVVSDDNRSLFQRTILLTFALLTPLPTPRPSD